MPNIEDNDLEKKFLAADAAGDTASAAVFAKEIKARRTAAPVAGGGPVAAPPAEGVVGGQQVETSPIPYKPNEMLDRSGGMWGEEPTVVDINPPSVKKSADQGVDIYGNADLDAKTYLQAGLAKTPQDRVAFYLPHLAKKYGWKNPGDFVRMDPNNPESGQFFNPDTRRWTPIEREHSPFPNLAKTAPVVGNLLEGGGALGGSVLAQVSNPEAPGLAAYGGGIAGAGAGRGVYEAARAGLANHFKVGDPTSLSSGIENTAYAAGKAGAEFGAFGAGTYTAGLMRGMLRGFKVPFSSTEANILLNKQNQYAPMLEAINDTPDMVAARQARLKDLIGPQWDKMSDKQRTQYMEQLRYSPRADQYASNPAIDKKVGAAQSRAAVSSAMAADAENGYDVIRLFFDNMNKPFEKIGLSEGTSVSHNAGALPLEALRAEKQAVVGPAEAGVRNAQQGLETGSKSVPKGQPDAGVGGANIRDSVQEMDNISSDAYNKAYADFSTAIGDTGNYVSNHQVPASKGLLKFMTKLQSLSDSGLSKEQMDPASKLMVRLEKEGDPVDLTVLQDNIRRQREISRREQYGTVDAGGLLPGDRKQLIKEMVSMRASYLSTNFPEGKELLDKADTMFRIHANTFRDGFVGKMLKTDGNGNYLMEDPDVVTKMLHSKNGVATQQLADLASGSPALQNELRHVAFADYRSAVMKDGKTIDLDAHNKYIADNWATVAPLFAKEDQKLIKTAGGFATALLKSQQKLEKANEAWKTMQGGKFAKAQAYDPAGMVNMVFGGNKLKEFTPDDISAIRSLVLKHTDGGLENWQAGVMSRLSKDVLDISNNRIDPIRIDKMLTGSTGDRLRRVLGSDYVENLKTVSEALKINNKNPESVDLLGNLSGSPRFTRAIRAKESVFSGVGRFTTWAQKERQDTTAGAIYKALNDPNELSRLANLERNRAARIRYGGVGVGVLKNDWDSNNGP